MNRRKLTRRAREWSRLISLLYKTHDAQSFVCKYTVKTRKREEPTVTFNKKYVIKNLENSIRLPKDTIEVLFLFLTW